MAQLLIRKLPDEVKARLKRRAKRRGCSLEAEARDILCQAAEPAQSEVASESIWVAELAEEMRKIGVSRSDIEALDKSIEDLRQDRRVFEFER